MLGQGCSQAFEDAWALGRAIGEHGATPEALQAYQSVRVPLAGAVQEASLGMFRDMMQGKRGKSEYEVNSELGFTRREFEPLRAVTVAAN
jgi:2-polyprenyl-6-methoxyphenol hydroxylase-like FAD-dependent oxidoreductase